MTLSAANPVTIVRSTSTGGSLRHAGLGKVNRVSQSVNEAIQYTCRLTLREELSTFLFLAWTISGTGTGMADNTQLRFVDCTTEKRASLAPLRIVDTSTERKSY